MELSQTSAPEAGKLRVGDVTAFRIRMVPVYTVMEVRKRGLVCENHTASEFKVLGADSPPYIWNLGE